MKFTHTIAAARGVEERTWAVADGLVQDFTEASTQPLIQDFKDAADALEGIGLSYLPKTLADYWRVASVFTKSRRRSSASVKVYEEILNPLWQRMEPDTRSNDLVAIASEFFKTEPKPSALKARAWAKSQAAGLDAERKARNEATAKKEAKDALAVAEKEMASALKDDNMDEARKILVTVNGLRQRLGMDLLKLDEDEIKPDEEATEEAAKEAEEKKAERLHAEAVHEVEYALARVGMAVSALGNAYIRVQEDLTLEDRDYFSEEIGLREGRLALIRSQFGGTTSEDALAEALSQWESEAATG